MKYVIKGPNIANGSVEISGAKNFSIKALAASTLVFGKTYYKNVPNNLDVHKTLNLLSELGAKIEFDVLAKECMIDTTNLNNIAQDQENANMIMFLIAAGLSHRFDKIALPKNKGCSLGTRAIDFHVTAFNSFGSEFSEDDVLQWFSKNNDLIGCEIELPYPSVGATETALFLAVLAKGVSKIKNAAVEPEVEALITALTIMGANIYFESDRTIVIEGVKSLKVGATIYIHGDILEAATWASLAYATNGKIIVNGITPEFIGSFLGFFTMAGGCIEQIGPTSLAFSRVKDLSLSFEKRDIHAQTGVFPALRTDLQPILAAMCATGHQKLKIHETVYDDRVNYAQSFAQFGLQVDVSKFCDDAQCKFYGKEHVLELSSSELLVAPKNIIHPQTIRNGMAKIILAAAAHGETIIDHVEIIERGYCNLFNKLQSLGVDISLIQN